MQQNTALAMWDSRNDYDMFDFATYTTCKRILRIKDEEIARLYSARLLDWSQNHTTHVLDVGSSDGSLLNQILTYMNGHKHRPFVIDCVEPNRLGLRHLSQSQRTFAGYGATLNIFPTPIQHFLLHPPRGPYDIILCTHLFYHIPREQWHQVVSDLLACLKSDDGRLFICLVSSDSDIYRVWDSIERTVTSEGLPRRFDDEGEFIFAEDMRAFLMQKGIQPQSHKIEATLRFSSYDCTQYIDHVAHGTAEASLVMRFFAYMLRLHPKDLVHVYNGLDIMQLCQHDELAFRSIDYVFEIKTHPSFNRERCHV